MPAERLKSRVLSLLLRSPVTLIPSVGGVTVLAVAWALSASPLLMFGGAAGILIGVGTFLTRLVLPSQRLVQEAADELREEDWQAREQSLNELARKLGADKDQRDDQLLRDLRRLHDTFSKTDKWRQRLNSVSVFDILSGVDELFQCSIRLLEESYELLVTGRDLEKASARRPLEKRRDELLKEVSQNVDKLVNLFDAIQQIGTQGDSTSDVVRLRHELDSHLEVARRVDARMRGFPTHGDAIRDEN